VHILHFSHIQLPYSNKIENIFCAQSPFLLRPTHTFAVHIFIMDGHSAAPDAVPSNVDHIYTSGYEEKKPRSEYFRSRRVKPEEVERPWLDEKHPRQFWICFFPILGFVLGLMVTGLLIWHGVRSVARHNYCEIFNDEFTSWRDDVWTKEVEVGGFG
jgi:hypothetical protein